MSRRLAPLLCALLLAAQAGAAHNSKYNRHGGARGRNLLQDTTGGTGTGSTGTGGGTSTGTTGTRTGGTGTGTTGTGVARSPPAPPGARRSPPPSPGARRSPPPPPGKAGAFPPSASVFTAIEVGQETVSCNVWSEDAGMFDIPRTAPEYGAKGNTVPPSSQVTPLTQQICDDPKAAGDKLRAAVEAGGTQAQAWVYALFNADCQDQRASEDTYGAAIDEVNSGDPADLEATKAWFTNFVKAADAVGIPVCASVAVVDENDGSVIEQENFHTG